MLVYFNAIFKFKIMPFKISFTIIFLSIIGVLATQPVKSQPNSKQIINNDIPPRGLITGIIVDASDNTTMEFCSVAIFNALDSTLITGGITGADGSFTLKNIPFGRYYLMANFMGYEKISVPDLLISKENNMIDIGTISLVLDSHNIDEVEIVADQAHVEYRLDRKIINVSQDLNASSGSAADVLQNTPSVSVDIDGNVSLRGSGNFTVLIDGKPTALSGSDALQQIPASAIRNIEIITNPSAKFDPDGMAGIINIISKKNALLGLSGIFNASVGTGDKYKGDFLLSYRTNKLNIYGGGSYSDETFGGGIYSLREFYKTDENNSFVLTNGDRSSNRYGKEIKGGLDIYLNEYNTLSFSGSKGNHRYGSGGIQNLRNYDSFLLYDDYSVNDNYGTHGGDYYELNLSYTKLFNSADHKLEFLAYMENHAGLDDDKQIEYAADMNYVINDLIAPISIRTNEIGDDYEYRFQADYTRPIGTEGKLEAGYQTRIDDSGESYLFEDYNPELDEWINNPIYTSGIDFFRNIQAVYSTFGNKLGLFQYQLGLRAEYTNRIVKTLKNNDEFVIDRIDLFPTLHLSRSFRNNNQLMFSYSKRIDRPRGWYLEPYETFMNANAIRKGNADLQPEYMHSLDLSFQKTYGKSFVALESYYKKTNNKIERIQSVYDADNNISLMTYDNINSDNSLGFELMLNYNQLKWLELNASTTLYRYWMEGAINGIDISRKSNNWDMRLNATFNLSSKTRMQIMNYFTGPSVTAQGESDAMFYTNIAIRQDFLDRKLSATLQLRDVWGSMKYSYSSYGQGFSNQTEITREPQVIMLSLSYKLNNYKQERSENYQEGGPGMGEGDMY
jgi:Outer membrane protein beta-barrel family/TonB-dependent Receptor Plug Domain